MTGDVSNGLLDVSNGLLDVGQYNPKDLSKRISHSFSFNFRVQTFAVLHLLIARLLQVDILKS